MQLNLRSKAMRQSHAKVAGSLFVATLALSPLTGIGAQDSASDSDTKKDSEYSLPGFDQAIPTGIEINPAERDEDGNRVRPQAKEGMSGPQLLSPSVQVGLSGQILGRFGDLDDIVRGDAMIVAKIDAGDLAVNLGISLEDLINQLDPDYEDVRNRTNGNGITDNLSKDYLNQLSVMLTPFRFSKDSEEVFALTLLAGRDQATPLNTTVVPEWSGILSTLNNRQLGEQDLIKVEATVFQTITVSVVNFGHDWFGYDEDIKQGQEQGEDADESWAINVGAQLEDVLGEDNDLEIWFSYANVAEGLFYSLATAADQPGENETYSAGLKFNVQKFLFAAEGYIMDAESMPSEEIGGEARVAYAFDRITPSLGIGFRRDGVTEDTDLIYKAEVAYAVAKNVTLAAGVAMTDPEQGDSQTSVYVGMSIQPHYVPVGTPKKRDV